MVQLKDAQPLPGTSYRLVRRIGVGSCSEVFEAVDGNGERRALKILHAMHEGESEVAARLVQEGRALAALDHPHLVKVYEVGMTGDRRPFLVMPRLCGETLRERLDARGPLEPAAAVRIAVQVLGGLSAAHGSGIVHRDVKPANVFLARHDDAAADHAVLIDFGIAKVSSGFMEPTTGSHVLGTPRYLSPEQILGGEIDARTDVYALGLVLFEAITGRGPFPLDDSMAVMRAHLSTPAPRLRSLLWVPPALDLAVARALEKSPALRWKSADAMAAALADAYSNEGGQSGAADEGGPSEENTLPEASTRQHLPPANAS